MTKNSGRKKKKSEVIRNASPVKIAYYIQRMLEKNMGTKEIIFIISSQFYNDDIREFAKKYRYCSHRDDIRRVASLIHSISKKNMDNAMETVAHDVLIKREIFSREYIQKHFLTN